MNYDKRLESTLAIINQRQEYLANYSLEDLLKTPGSDSWSLGQVYMHLIKATTFHIAQVEACITSPEHVSKSKTWKGFVSFSLLGGLPPIKIKVPASENYTPKQPESKEVITFGLDDIKQQLTNIITKLKQSSIQGKTPHPAFGYLNGDERFKLIEMHFIHHLLQKRRIDKFLSR